MTIASEITDLQNNLAAAKNAVTAKGGTVGNTGLAGLASEIAAIPSGGGGGVPDYEGYGIVLYYSMDFWGSAAVPYVMQSASDMSIFDGSVEDPYEVNIPNGDTGQIAGIVLGNLITSLPDNFARGYDSLAFCTLPSTITSIGNHVLDGAYNLFYLAIPEGVTSIGDQFLAGNQSLTHLVLPSTVTSIGTDFLANPIFFENLDVGSLPASVIASSNTTLSAPDPNYPTYTNGITVTGTYAADWLTKFPNSDTSPYRKLINGNS